MMKKIALIISLTWILSLGSVNDADTLPPVDLIHIPTDGVLQKQQFHFQLFTYANGGMLFSTRIGIIKPLTLGFAYGGESIIGERKINWNQRVEFSLKIRILEEKINRPAFCLGYDSQGLGPFVKSLSRYQLKSKGFFAAVSKNYKVYGNLGIHGGLNYSLEDKNDRNLNFFAGADKDILKNLFAKLEYDFAFNDNNKASLGRGRGYMHLGLDYQIAPEIQIEFILLDILKNREGAYDPVRTFRINYYTGF